MLVLPAALNRGYNIGKILEKNRISACYVESESMQRQAVQTNKKIKRTIFFQIVFSSVL